MFGNTVNRKYEERLETVVDSVDSIRVLNNNVLVEVTFLPEDDVKTKSGVIISGTKWNENPHVARWGVVKKLPKKLKFKTDVAKAMRGEFSMGMEWQTELDIEVGDKVFWGRLAGGSSPIVRCGDSVYFLVNYSEFILRIRDGEITPINGYAILEPVEEESIEIKGLILNFNKGQNRKLGVVKYLGKPNGGYLGSIMKDAECEVGDKVIFQGEKFIPLEDEMFAELEGGLGYCQRVWFVGKF